jgi:hypothetical protein
MLLSELPLQRLKEGIRVKHIIYNVYGTVIPPSEIHLRLHPSHSNLINGWFRIDFKTSKTIDLYLSDIYETKNYLIINQFKITRLKCLKK